MTASGIYTGRVTHTRVRPKPHKLDYDVASFLFDLDELPTLNRDVAGFSYNRFGFLSFYDRDHGPGTGEPLRPWVETQLARAGIDIAGGPIRLLSYPRVMGYVFNPLAVYFCYRPDASLAAILHQVTNTFHERHTYLIPVEHVDSDGVIHQTCAKELYVSPFIAMEATYDFRIKPPGEDVAVAIHQSDANGPLLYAAFSGRRSELTSRACLRTLARFPFLTLKVIGGIHWEALKLWLKGVPLVKHPQPPAEPVSVIKAKKFAA